MLVCADESLRNSKSAATIAVSTKLHSTQIQDLQQGTYVKHSHSNSANNCLMDNQWIVHTDVNHYAYSFEVYHGIYIGIHLVFL